MTNNSLSQATGGQILSSTMTPATDINLSGLSGNQTGNGTRSTNSSGTMVFGPAGRLIVTEPAPKFNFILRYRIGEKINFAWKYDENVKIKPINITLEVAGKDRNYYPLAVNVSGSTNKFLWDTSKWDPANGPLVEYNNYQVILYDERGRDALPEAGRLASYRGTSFALINPAGRF